MTKPYSLIIDIPRSLWLSSLGSESPGTRAHIRHELRQVVGRSAWRHAIAAGAGCVNRFALIVTVRGRGKESPILADETLKPLIDAGTDTKRWPDDDPTHRILTVYMRDPRPDTHASVALTVIPVQQWVQPQNLFLAASGAKSGTMRRLVIPDRAWLTSNLSRLPPEEIQNRLGMITRGSANLWDGIAMGERASALCTVKYPWLDYIGDPDNTAQSAIAAWGSGVLTGALPHDPLAFAFCADLKHESEPHTHEITMTVLQGGYGGADLLGSYLKQA